MDSKMLFLVNPNAGKGEIRRLGFDCIDIFVKAGWNVQVQTTQRALQATEIIAKVGGQYDRIVCSGGDGTLNEVVSGLQLGGHQTPLGYIPAGTVNDFARSLGIPKNLIAAATLAVNGTLSGIDIGRFGQRYFTYIAAFGAFTDVAYNTPQPVKNVLGRAAYVLEGVKSVPNIKSYKMRIETEHEVHEGNYVYGMISNSTSVAGIKELSPHDVEMDDGLFEVLLVSLPKNAAQWQRALFELTNPEQEWSYVKRFKAAKIAIKSEDAAPWTLDGEYGGRLHKIDVVNCPQALHIFTKPE